MKAVLLSEFGDAWFVARRLQREGHTVAMHIFDPASRKVGDGFVEKLPYPTVSRGTDLVLFDGTGRGELGQKLRAQGFAVIGGNPLDHDLEVDRTKGTAFMRQVGIKTPPTYAFTTLAQGEAFLATHPGRWYFKPSGDVATDLTRNGDARAVRRFLAWAGRSGAKFRGFELQRAQDGAEVSVEGWFDGRRWVGPCNSTLETKKFCVGDLGPRTGCQANVVWPYRMTNPVLFGKTVERMAPLLRAAKYVGPLDLNCIIGDDGTPYGLEWSARTGFDALQAWSLLIRGNWGEQLAAFAHGKLERWDVAPAFGLTLRLSTSPYPMDDAKIAAESTGLPLDPDLVKNPETTFLDDVRMGKDGLPELAGRDGSVCCVGAVGTDWRALQKQVLAKADDLDIPSKAYRMDVVPDAERRWDALREHGYLDGFLVKETKPAGAKMTRRVVDPPADVIGGAA